MSTSGDTARKPSTSPCAPADPHLTCDLDEPPHGHIRGHPAPDAPRGAGRGPLRYARSESTQEHPRGYGNPDKGWRHLVSSTVLETGPVPNAPDDLHAFAVRTEAFAAHIGDPAGDAHSEPELTLSAC
ncbi:hypothetical protein AQI96_09465 [Streptomyces canus]|nr:hypothetical protein AQI96_09465 [Streptomyces canus]